MIAPDTSHQTGLLLLRHHPGPTLSQPSNVVSAKLKMSATLPTQPNLEKFVRRVSHVKPMNPVRLVKPASLPSSRPKIPPRFRPDLHPRVPQP